MDVAMLIEFPKDRMRRARPRRRSQGRCSRGHEFTIANTVLNERGRRVCLACSPGDGTDAQRRRRVEEARRTQWAMADRSALPRSFPGADGGTPWR